MKTTLTATDGHEGDPPGILPYERLSPDIWKHFLLLEGESVLVRHAFRWHRNGEVVSNAYESHSLESVCEERGWKIVARFGEHIAIIKEQKGTEA